MAKTSSNPRPADQALQDGDVPDQVVSQVGKAVAEILKLRQSLEENMAVAQSDEEKQSLADQVEGAAVRAISDQGLTVDQYNQVITAAQAEFGSGRARADCLPGCLIHRHPLRGVLDRDVAARSWENAMTEFRMGALAATLVVAASVAVPAVAQQGGGNATAPQSPGATTQKDQLSDAMVQEGRQGAA